MAQPWSQVEQSDQFKQLPPEEQWKARNQYFDEVVAPKVPQDKLNDVKQQFIKDTNPTMQPQKVDMPKSYWEKVKDTGSKYDEEVKKAGILAPLKVINDAASTAVDMGLGLVGDVAGAATSVLTQDPKKGEAVKKALTLEPETKSGALANEYVGAVAQPVSTVLGAPADYLKEHGHPIASQVATAATDVLPVKGLAKGAKVAGEIASKAKEPLNTVARRLKSEPKVIDTSNPVGEARAAGYKLKPSDSGGKVGKVAEGLAGSPKLEVEAAIKNQKITNKLAADEIGVKGPITRASLQAAKAPHNAMYDRIGKELGDITTDEQYHAELEDVGRTPGTSFQNAKSPAIDKLKEAYSEKQFNAADAIQETRKLRAAASKNIKAPFDPERNELGYAQRAISDAIENQMERHGEAIGKGDLIEQFKNSRKSLAKIHSVESSLVGATGDISAHGLAKQARRGAPLSGNLKKIANVADNFPSETRDASKLKNKVPITVLEGAFGGGAAAFGHPALAAGMIARPLTRKILLSDMYQNTLPKKIKVKDIPKEEEKPQYTSKPAVKKKTKEKATTE